MKLQARRWTPLPDTSVMVRWDGSQEIAVYQRGGIWDLSPLVVGRGVVLGWLALVDHPELGPWPMVPLTVCRRNLYRGRYGTGCRAGTTARSTADPISRRLDPIRTV